MDINSDGTDRCSGGSIAFFSQCLNIFKQKEFVDLKANTFVLIYDLSL